MYGGGKMSGALVTLYEMYNQYSLWLSTLTGGKAKGHWLWVKTNSKLSQSVLAYCHWQEKRCTGYGYCHNQYSHTVTDRRKRCTGYGYCHNQYLHTVTDRRKGALVMGTVTINTRILSLTGEKVYWLWVLSQSVHAYCHWQEKRCTGYGYCHNQYSHTVTDRRKGVLVMGTVTISTHMLPLSPLTGGKEHWVKHKLSLSPLTGGEEHWLWVKHKLSQSVLPYCHYQYWQEARSTGYKWNINCPVRTCILSLSPLTGGEGHCYEWSINSQSVLPYCHYQYW